MQFSTRELRDLAVAWLALGFAFSLLYVDVTATTMGDVLTSAPFAEEFLLSLATVGVAFLLHVLALQRPARSTP